MQIPQSEENTMIYKQPSTHPGFARVTFELPSCVWADRVAVTGSFNDWDDKGVPLVQMRDGVWRATIELPVGKRYEFRYIIDGRWQSDNHADGFADNAYGGQNSVIDLVSFQTATLTERQPSKVSESHPIVAPHLPTPIEGSVRGFSGERTPAEMPRMRPRVAAA
jgi:1,4-alpha-glucan branching enzyme